MKKWQIIKLEWLDSCHDAGWKDQNDFKSDKKFLIHETVGFFFRETDYSISVVQSKTKEDKTYCNCDALMEIPKCSILKKTLL